MAWTDSCKIEAVAQIKKRAEEGTIRDAIKLLSNESGIPIETLRNWYWPERKEKYIEGQKSVNIDTIEDEFIQEQIQQSECLLYVSTIG